MGRRIVVGGLAVMVGLRSVHSQRCAAPNAPDKMLWMPRIVLAFIGWQTCGTAPGQPAIVARAGPPSAQARITAGLSGNDRGTAVPHDDQAVRGERLQGVPHDAGADALQGTHLGDRRQLVARGEDPCRMASVSAAVTCCQAGRESRGLTVSTGTLRCSMNGLPVQDRSPQRLSSAYSLSRMGRAPSAPSWDRGRA